MRAVLTSLHGFALVLAAASCAQQTGVQPESWRAWLDSPGGELPFGLELQPDKAGPHAWIVNGPERIPVPEVTIEGNELVLNLAHYDAKVRASLSADGMRLDGEWSKRIGTEKWAKLPFHATRGKASRFTPLAASEGDVPGPGIDGRWSVDFSSDEEPAVGIFENRTDGSVTGTFLTTTGDYRYLAGSLEGSRLRLSCFDGAHAFLFHATLRPDGSLRGDFWSRDSWHETWTARRDATAALPDALGLTRWTGARALEELVFPDLEGNPRSLADREFAGTARLLQVFGSWCPNCNDASRYMVELDRRYRDRGLSIVGLAFEVTGDFQRDAEQVRRYAERHQVDYPLLVAGLSDKGEASRAFPVLDRVRAYPTTIFMDSEGSVRAIYTGFSGPATGSAHDTLREQFKTLIEELLGGSGSKPPPPPETEP